MNGRLLARAALAGFVGLAAMISTIGGVAAHGPDPVMGGALWAQDQAVTYQWASGQAPPAWMAGAIDAAAAGAGLSRASRAATFARVASGSASAIAYGEPTGCSAAGIACFDRSGAPNQFRMWFRAHGFVFDWGTLRWCQGLTTIADGCFDAQTVALDEFGHVEGLGHHVNNADGSDFLDAVVQTVSRARPQVGWQVHAFGPCDTARLQLEYDRQTSYAAFSTCLAVATTTTLGASPGSLWAGDSARFTATIRTSSSTALRALANDPVSGRIVTLQRRLNATQAWNNVGTMVPNAGTEGTYVFTTSPSATYEWRAVFTAVPGDGALGSASAALRVTVSTCSKKVCPTGFLR